MSSGTTSSAGNSTLLPDMEFAIHRIPSSHDLVIPTPRTVAADDVLDHQRRVKDLEQEKRNEGERNQQREDELNRQRVTKGDQEEPDGEQQGGRGERVSLRERLKHFTWAWFTGTMSSGGISLLLAETPHRFHGLYTIGLIVFLLHLTFFLLLCLVMLARAILFRRHFLHSLTRPTEMFYFGAFWLTTATVLGCVEEYGVRMGPERNWLIHALRVLFWLYLGCTIVTAWAQYYIFFRYAPSSIFVMNPAWFLPAFSVMLTGTLASLIAPDQPPASRMPIIVAGVTCQGYGWLWSYVLTVIYTTRLINSGLPVRKQRPGLFFLVGAIGYTGTALMGLASVVPRDYGYFATHPYSVEIVQALALWTSIFIWLFGFFLIGLATLSCMVCVPQMGFTLAWWAFVFPNIGFTIATIKIGRQLGSEGILWVASAMTIVLVVMWLFTMVALIRAVKLGQIMWPGRDDDKDIG